MVAVNATVGVKVSVAVDVGAEVAVMAEVAVNDIAVGVACCWGAGAQAVASNKSNKNSFDLISSLQNLFDIILSDTCLGRKCRGVQVNE